MRMFVTQMCFGKKRPACFNVLIIVHRTVDNIFEVHYFKVLYDENRKANETVKYKAVMLLLVQNL